MDSFESFKFDGVAQWLRGADAMGSSGREINLVGMGKSSVGMCVCRLGMNGLNCCDRVSRVLPRMLVGYRW